MSKEEALEYGISCTRNLVPWYSSAEERKSKVKKALRLKKASLLHCPSAAHTVLTPALSVSPPQKMATACTPIE